MGQRHTRFSEQVQDMRRRVVMEAALATFAEKGCFGTSIKDIAERAGVATGAVYAHYASKEELLAAVARHRVAEAERLWSSVGEGRDVRGALIALTEGLLWAVASGPALSLLVGRRLSCQQRWSGVEEGPPDYLEELVVSILARAEAQGQVRAGMDHRLIAVLFLSVFSSRLLAERLAEGNHAEVAEELVRCLLDGVRADSGEAG